MRTHEYSLNFSSGKPHPCFSIGQFPADSLSRFCHGWLRFLLMGKRKGQPFFGCPCGKFIWFYCARLVLKRDSRNLSGHPTVSSGYHSYNAEHNGKANEKISGDIAQIQKAAARYSYCTYDSYDRQNSHNNACNFANGLFHAEPPYHFRFIDCNFILLSQDDSMILTYIWGRVGGA